VLTETDAGLPVDECIIERVHQRDDRRTTKQDRFPTPLPEDGHRASNWSAARTSIEKRMTTALSPRSSQRHFRRL
jgi:hypothetical protein